MYKPLHCMQERMNGMVDYLDFGTRVRICRRKMGLTQEELAEKVGISASFMGHIERGTRVASLDTLVALCNELHTSPQTLLQASLNDLDEHMPSELGPDERSQLRHLFRLAQDTIDHWYD